MSSTPAQFIRYIAVGLVSNTVGYLTYLLLTLVGIPPVIAMTLLYVTAATIAFLGNRSLTFEYQGNQKPAIVKFIIAYSVGYLINLIVLGIFYGLIGLPHQLAYAASIVVVALFLFTVQKYWVFTGSDPSTSSRSETR